MKRSPLVELVEGTDGAPRVVLHEIKAVLVLEPHEIAELLQRDRDLWIVALKRGKYLLRARSTSRREEVAKWLN